jgi:hypothetical protein
MDDRWRKREKKKKTTSMHHRKRVKQKPRGGLSYHVKYAPSFWKFYPPNQKEDSALVWARTVTFDL